MPSKFNHALAMMSALVATLAATAAFGPGAAAAAKPAADCQPYSGRPCLFPFPDNRFTRPDKHSVTGARVKLPANAMPANTNGQRIAVGPYDRNDGFSPGSAILLHIPGLDTQAAMNRTGAVPLTNMARAFAKRQPIVVIDQATGKRQLIWSELDSSATDAADRDLLIHPGKDFLDGHTYIVALRNLRTANGKRIAAPRWFQRLRAGGRLPAAMRSARHRYARIFRALGRAGIDRSSLYEAWNFTVMSRQDLTGRLLAIRNNAFAQLGDHNLADNKVQGNAPSFQITGTSILPARVGRHRTDAKHHRHLPDPVLPGRLRGERERGLPLQLEQAGRDADAAAGQRRDCVVRVHRPELRDAIEPGPDLALRPRPARLPHRGRSDQRPGHGQRAQHGLLRDRLVGPRRGRHAQRRRRGEEPEPVPGGRRPAPAGRAQHAVPRPADAQPEGIRGQPGVPAPRTPADPGPRTCTTTATARAGSRAV